MTDQADRTREARRGEMQSCVNQDLKYLQLCLSKNRANHRIFCRFSDRGQSPSHTHVTSMGKGLTCVHSIYHLRLYRAPRWRRLAVTWGVSHTVHRHSVPSRCTSSASSSVSCYTPLHSTRAQRFCVLHPPPLVPLSACASWPRCRCDVDVRLRIDFPTWRIHAPFLAHQRPTKAVARHSASFLRRNHVVVGTTVWALLRYAPLATDPTSEFRHYAHPAVVSK